MRNMEKTREEWKQAILDAWKVYGTGKPLDPELVEWLADQYAKPMEIRPWRP